MMNRDHPDEETIIRKCLDGDADSYAALVDRYKAMVYNVAYRMVGDQDAANDLGQESFISAYNGLERFRFGSKFSSWLYSIVLNKCRDHLRSAKKTVSTEEIEDIRLDCAVSPEQAVSAGESRDILQHALDAIPAEYRQVLILKHIEELDYGEIAEITGAGIPALKVRAHRGREMLKKVLEEAGVSHG